MFARAKNMKMAIQKFLIFFRSLLWQFSSNHIAFFCIMQSVIVRLCILCLVMNNWWNSDSRLRERVEEKVVKLLEKGLLLFLRHVPSVGNLNPPIIRISGIGEVENFGFPDFPRSNTFFQVSGKESAQGRLRIT